MGMEQIRPTEILLYSENDSISLENSSSTKIGSLARSSIGVGIVAALLGSTRVLLVSLLKGSDAQISKSGQQEWTFEEGQCWFFLMDEARLNQSSIVCYNFFVCFINIEKELRLAKYFFNDRLWISKT